MKKLLTPRVFSVVGEVGLEPTTGFPDDILSVERIPFRHSPMREKGSKQLDFLQ